MIKMLKYFVQQLMSVLGKSRENSSTIRIDPNPHTAETLHKLILWCNENCRYKWELDVEHNSGKITRYIFTFRNKEEAVTFGLMHK
ncbi:hypothetical protein [Pseudomonas phage vB_Pa-PAC2]